MCTLTIVPKKDGFIFTSNRDEAKSRKMAKFPCYQTINDKKVLFPQDGNAFGSWIALNENRIVNLLNGAKKVYQHQPPYRKSRGLVLLDSFNYLDIHQFAAKYNMENIAPFTLVCLKFQPQLALVEIRWDGKAVSTKDFDPNKAHIFSSFQLYPKKIREEREELFSSFLQGKKSITQKDLVHFHEFGGSKNVPIQLDESHFVRTVSITSVEKKNHDLLMQYHDLQQKKVITEVFQSGAS